MLTGVLLCDYGNGQYAWGKVLFDKLGKVGPYLARYDASGQLKLVQIEPITPDDIVNDFWSNPDLYVKP